jgi:hypothetical protein
MMVITQKEAFLSQREHDIKFMENGFGVLNDLNRYVWVFASFKLFFVYTALNWTKTFIHVIHVDGYREVSL